MRHAAAIAGTPMTDQPTRAMPGTPSELQDGRFVTGDVLGTGGMAIVVSAEDTLLGRTVAVKLLSDALAYEPEARERFSREARSMAGLSHANVVQVYDVGEVDERPYFIMEHVAGGSLAERLKAEGPVPPDEVDRVAVEALRGLDHAHSNGLLHRDLKPANLLVASDGTIKVTDFGVARAAESQTLTRTGIVLGTMRYLAPERLRGQGSTEASDLYGLGATLYELLTAAGIDPKKEEDPLRRLPAATPAALRTFLESTLAEDPADRPRSAREALELWGADQTRGLTTESTVQPTQPVDPDAPTRANRTGPTASRGEEAAGRAGDGRLDLSPRARRRLLAGLAVLGLVLALSAVSTSTTEQEPGAPETAPAAGNDGTGTGTGQGIPPGDSPAESARNTADWLRDLGD